MTGEVDRLIEAARVEGTATVDLSGQGLTEVPEAVRPLRGVTALGLHNNSLTRLPEWLGELTQLTVLSVGGNQLTDLPESLVHLTALDSLQLQNNQLEEAPDWLGNLTSLTELHLQGNRLTRLPETLGRLTALEALLVNENHLVRLPESLGQLVALEYLDVSCNQLTELPPSLAGLTKLTTLTLGVNLFTALPRWLADLPLTDCDLDLSELDLTRISDVWFRSTLSPVELAAELGAQGAEAGAENYWEWVIAAFGGVNIDITRPRPDQVAPGAADTRIFRWAGSSGFFPQQVVRALVAGLRAIGIDPVHTGRWNYRGGDEYDKELDDLDQGSHDTVD